MGRRNVNIGSEFSPGYLSRLYAATPTNEHCRKLRGQVSTVSFDNNTMQLQLAVRAPFDAVKIVFENIHTSAYTMYAAVAASETAANVIHPVIGGSQKTSAGDWAHVLASGSEPITVALGAANNPIFTSSDWVNCKSVDRTDVVGSYPLLMVRAFIANSTGTVSRWAGVGNTTEGSSTFEADWEALTAMIWRVRYHAGDCITTPSSMTNSLANFIAPAFSVVTRTRGYGLSFMTIGNSIEEGIYSNGLSAGFYNFSFQACELAHRAGYPCHYINQGWNGQTGANFLINGKAAITALKPNAVFFPAWSPNDGTSQANFDAAFQRALEMIAFCRANGVVPVILTLWPTALGSSIYAEYNTKTRALKDSGVLVFDVDAIVGTGSASARSYISAYNAGDNLHMNNLGHAALAPYAADILTKIINSTLYS